MNNRKYWVLGLVGCACFGIGDWLLGFVNPEMVNSAFSVLKAGHGVGYDLSKITWTLLAGALGVPMMLAGCNHMAELATDALWKRILRFFHAAFAGRMAADPFYGFLWDLRLCLEYAV